MADNSHSTLLQPGQLIRPRTNPTIACDLVRDLYGLTVTSVKELVSYDDRNYLVQVEAEHSNANIKQLWPHGYMLKVLNLMDSQKCHVDAEHEMQKLLMNDGIQCPQPVLTLEGNERTLQVINYGTEWQQNNDPNDKPCGKHIVRLLTFVPGQILHSVPYTANLMYNVGQMLGRVDKALKGYSHPALMSHQSVWNLINLSKLHDFLFAVTDDDDRQVIEQVLDSFEREVIPNLDKCQKSVIHGDYNEQNIIVRALPGQDNIAENDRLYESHGIIDFGDSSDSYLLFEVAVCCMYMMVESKIVDPLLVSSHVLAGYYQHMQLNDTEKDLLKVCMAGRFCQSLVMGAYSYQLDPGNEYLLVTAKNGWRLLHLLWSTPKQQLYENWNKVIDGYKKNSSS